MGKFIKKMEDFIKERKDKTFFNAKTLSKGVLDTSFYFIFQSIKAFIKGNPGIKEVSIFELGLIPSIEGNQEVKEKCKSILHEYKKNKIVSNEDKEWLEKQLLPWVEESLKKQTGKTFAALDAVNENKIDEFVNKLKKEKNINGVVYK